MRILSLIAVLTLLTGCQRPPRPADGLAVTPDEFRGLQWLSGRWDGTGPDTLSFWESYLFLDDSTIRSYTWADSTFTQISDSSLLTLREGRVISGSGERWHVLTRWDRGGLRFEPRGKATNAFTWRPIDSSSWIAILTWTDADGKPQARRYSMRRHQL